MKNENNITITKSAVFTLEESYHCKEKYATFRTKCKVRNRKNNKQTYIDIPFSYRFNITTFIESMLYYMEPVLVHCRETNSFNSVELLYERQFYQKQAEKLININLIPDDLFSELVWGGQTK